MVNIGNSWDEILKEEFEKEYYQKLRRFLVEEYSNHTVYPDMNDIFNAFKATAYEDVKVVIMGQDPYHEPGQAHGMAFSVKKGVKTPPSLVNIYKEMKDDLGIEPVNHGYLKEWADQGVLLLNSVLTVREHQANSHKKKGWEQLTEAAFAKLNEREKPMVFILWGNNAKQRGQLITNPNHLILTGAHPSPLSAYNGFYGGKYFSKANEFLIKTGQSPVNWQLSE